MKTKTITPPDPDVAGIVKAMIKGEERLEVALAAWRERHGLRLTDVSRMIGYQPSAVSAMLHDPARLPGVRDAVAQLIGYRERAPDAAEKS